MNYKSPLQLAREVAPSDPRLAFQLAQVRSRLLGFHTVQIDFATGVVESPVDGAFPTTLGEDFYVVDIRSTVQRPNAFTGNIFKAQSDVFNAQQSGIWVQVQVVGGTPGNKYLVNEYMMPLEMIAPPVAGSTCSAICGTHAVLKYTQNVRIGAVLRRAYPENELPLIMAVTFIGWSLGCTNYESAMSARDAVSNLRGMPEFEDIRFPEIR